MIDVSVIIVNWNTCDILRDCLNSIYAQPIQVSCEVIVVDNGSTDGSVSMIESEFPLTRVVANESNRGFASANNQGIEKAEGRYVLLLNSDTVILDNAIGKTLGFADAHPEAAVVGCRVLNPDRSLQPTCFKYPSVLNKILFSTCLYKLFPRSRFFGRERMSWWQRDDSRPVDVVTGCYMLVRKEAIDQVGLLDENYFMYGEETDWCYRFSNAGWKILFSPAAEIIHLGGASSIRMKHEMRLQLEASILLFFKKHRSRVSYFFACFLSIVFFLIRVPYWLVRALFQRKDQEVYLGVVRTYLMGAMGALRGAEGLCVKK
jgi:hypothetical protein